MDALAIDRAALVGNSFGGAVALRAAAVAPDRVTALALISAPAPGVEPSDELEAAWAAEEEALEAANRAWHIAYTSPNIFGIQAAVSAGLGVSILPGVAILPDHSILSAGDGFPPIIDTEVALVAAPEASPATRRLAEALADFCSTLDPRMAA